ncbi:hypothetical protein [Aquimarina sp. AU58]|uniref:hypothetical protein n=1 Tax=Aquimarina sp. AU58 TaxID=1874112 RepID=UPI000D6E8952|nr:hypothetical protein [Aquimarina sp. AU58]
MKKLTIIFIALIGISSFISCDSSEETENDIETRTEWECGTHNGNTLYTGPQGGCYYYNSNGNKTYVDRSECNC